jgi:DNA-binding SARP family transcriptional activator
MEFELLGEMRARHDGRELPLGAERQRAVLAVLLMEPGHVVPVPRIIARAWPDHPPETAADLVTGYVSRLRGCLAPAAGHVELVFRDQGYSVQVDAGQIDVHLFNTLLRQGRRDRTAGKLDCAARNLQQALGLWRGTPFADVGTPWLREQRVRLERARLDAVEALTEIELEAGTGAGSMTHARELAEAHPERERLTVLTVRALTARGESGQAVALAASAIHALHRQGLDPGPELKQAHLDALRPRGGAAAG